jgi:hypothetical protein
VSRTVFRSPFSAACRNAHMFDVIERLKSEWTDRYVVINSSAPELARFVNSTGTVRTVNMNGRCLVEFDQFNNTGWYDIDPSALKIVPQPLPKTVEKEAAKPAASAKAAPAKAAPAKAAPKPAGAGKPSTADILAAARAKAGGAAVPAAAKPAPAAKQPAAKPEATPAAVSGGKLSTAEILARARAAKAAAAPPVSPAAPVVDEGGEESQPTVAEAAPVKPAAAKKPAAGGPAPTTTAEKIAWCREHDAHG